MRLRCKPVHQTTLVSLTVLALLLGCGSATAATIGISDNFNDNSLNPSLWAPAIIGDGVVSEVNQRLETTILASPAHSTSSAFAGVALVGTIGGDFDVSVRYELLVPLPLSHGDTAGLILVGEEFGVFGYGVGRDVHTLWSGTEWVLGNAYVAAVGGGEEVTATQDISGQVRLTRVGASFSAYYWAGSGWQLIAAGTGSTDPMSLALGTTILGPELVSIAFDDFSLTADQFTPPIPEPATLLLLGAGLAATAVVRRRMKKRT